MSGVANHPSSQPTKPLGLTWISGLDAFCSPSSPLRHCLHVAVERTFGVRAVFDATDVIYAFTRRRRRADCSACARRQLRRTARPKSPSSNQQVSQAQQHSIKMERCHTSFHRTEIKIKDPVEKNANLTNYRIASPQPRMQMPQITPPRRGLSRQDLRTCRFRASRRVPRDGGRPPAAVRTVHRSGTKGRWHASSRRPV